jgi:hypothetical protein
MNLDKFINDLTSKVDNIEEFVDHFNKATFNTVQKAENTVNKAIKIIEKKSVEKK